jgi:hypothetical protein
MAKRNSGNGQSGKRKDNPNELDIPVEFSGVSIGKDTARLGIVVGRGDLNWSKVERFFCNSRLEASIVVEVKGYHATSKAFGAGLTFALEEIDVGALAKFAKNHGRLKAVRVGDASDGEAEERLPEDATEEMFPEERSTLIAEITREPEGEEAVRLEAPMRGLVPRDYSDTFAKVFDIEDPSVGDWQDAREDSGIDKVHAQMQDANGRLTEGKLRRAYEILAQFVSDHAKDTAKTTAAAGV